MSLGKMKDRNESRSRSGRYRVGGGMNMYIRNCDCSIDGSSAESGQNRE